ncbi:hypothetical protein GQ53DRAFT_846993 [Thozetella sp. PMI_491]|nr:hypothetical protein GQ53DRAFT_846993 [Thozetella sp. PMI_491]
MKYYLEYMCHWFDLCDQKRHFAVELPRRAVTSPILLNAIFALSARHLSFTSQFDSYAADRYHKRCLQQLGNIPHDSSALLDDDLLSATILLRTLEEIDVKLLGIDHEGHLLGIQAFLNTPGPPNQPTSPLRQASFWIGLRQEIVVAFANQRSINLSLDLDFIDQSLNDADDDTWANRIIVNCAHVVQYCFGGEEHSSKRFEELKSYDEQWLRARPSSFLPLAYTEPNREAGEVFPTILYLNHAVVIGLVHSIFARILLLCYNPLLPKIGAGHRLVQARTQEAIRQQVRELCGTALSNPATIPAMFTASMGVAAAGDRFDDHAERLALLEVLNKTETEHAWPTAASQRNLRESWQWVDDQECSW